MTAGDAPAVNCQTEALDPRTGIHWWYAAPAITSGDADIEVTVSAAFPDGRVDTYGPLALAQVRDGVWSDGRRLTASLRATADGRGLDIDHHSIDLSVRAETGGCGDREQWTRESRAGHGRMRASTRWQIDPGTGLDVLRGFVELEPIPDITPRCESIRIAQIARVERRPGEDYEWPAGQTARNRIRTRTEDGAGVRPGFYIDHDALRCTPGAACSPYFRDSWPNATESQDGAYTEGRSAPASLVDYPFGWSQIFRISLEACARCVDDGAFIGCARWGGEWPLIGSRVLHVPAFAATPSPTFQAALRRFEALYAPTGP